MGTAHMIAWWNRMKLILSPEGPAPARHEGQSCLTCCCMSDPTVKESSTVATSGRERLTVEQARSKVEGEVIGYSQTVALVTDKDMWSAVRNDEQWQSFARSLDDLIAAVQRSADGRQSEPIGWRSELESGIERLRVELQTPTDVWSGHIEEALIHFTAALHSAASTIEALEKERDALRNTLSRHLPCKAEVQLAEAEFERDEARQERDALKLEGKTLDVIDTLADAEFEDGELESPQDMIAQVVADAQRDLLARVEPEHGYCPSCARDRRFYCMFHDDDGDWLTCCANCQRIIKREPADPPQPAQERP